MTDEAKAWHHHRWRVLGTANTWVAYQATIQAEYQDVQEAANAYAELSRLRYKGDIKAYLNEFCTLNLIAGATGQGLQEKIDLAMPEDILDLRAAQFRGILVTDEDFLAATEEARQQIECNKVLKAMCKELKGHHYTPDSTAGSKTLKDSSRDPKPMANSSPAFTARGTEKRIYSHWKDTLAGVSPCEVEEHKAAKAGCWRCSRDGYQFTECFAKTTKRVPPLPSVPTAAAAGSKRKWEDEEAGTPDGPAAKRIGATAEGPPDDDNREVPLWMENSEEDF